MPRSVRPAAEQGVDDGLEEGCDEEDGPNPRGAPAELRELERREYGQSAEE